MLSNIKRKKAYDELYLWPVFSEYIRLRGANDQGYVACFTCGIIKHWKQTDCGHGIPRQHRATKYNEINNQAQCKRCNGFEGGARELFKENMDKKYGRGTWDKLQVASRATCKLGKYEYDIMTELYKKKVRELKQR